MMTDVQSGKVNSRSGGLQAPTPSTLAHHSPWRRRVARPGDRASRVNGPISGGTGACPPERARHAVPSNEGDKASVVQPFRAGSSDDKTRAVADASGLPGGESHPTESSRYSILEDALAAVLSSDEESSIPEPHMRFVARADRLCKEVRQRLDAAQSEDPPSPADGRKLTTDGCFT